MFEENFRNTILGNDFVFECLGYAAEIIKDDDLFNNIAETPHIKSS